MKKLKYENRSLKMLKSVLFMILFFFIVSQYREKSKNLLELGNKELRKLLSIYWIDF